MAAWLINLSQAQTSSLPSQKSNKMITNYTDFLNKSIFHDSVCANQLGDDMFEKM